MPANWRDGRPSLLDRHRRPARLSTVPGDAAHDQPVGAELAAVGHDVGVAHLGRQDRPEGGLAAQALVRVRG